MHCCVLTVQTFSDTCKAEAHSAFGRDSRVTSEGMEFANRLFAKDKLAIVDMFEPPAGLAQQLIPATRRISTTFVRVSFRIANMFSSGQILGLQNSVYSWHNLNVPKLGSRKDESELNSWEGIHPPSPSNKSARGLL